MKKIALGMVAAALALPMTANAASFDVAPAQGQPSAVSSVFSPVIGVESANQRRDRDYRRGYREGRRDTNARREWRGRDGRYYCERDDGTTGLLIGAGVGGLAGNEIAGRGDKTIGTVIGAVGGALIGREIDRSGGNRRCR